MKRKDDRHITEPDEQYFHHKFDDIEALVKRFDSVDRGEWQMPEKVIEMLQLSDTATVAEVGAGTGYFAVRLARHLTNGKVIALDKEPELVVYMRNRAEMLGLTNVDARLMETDEDFQLAENIDLILSVDMYHHIPNRVSYFSKFIECLKPDGNLVIIDRKTDSPDSHSHNRIPPEAVKEEMRAAGFKPIRDLDFLPYQYYLVFDAEETL